MRKLHEPLTLPKHPELLKRINELSISIQLFHTIKDEDHSRENLEKARAGHSMPKWEDVQVILSEAYHAINEQRENPIKY